MLRCSITGCYRQARNKGLCDLHFVEGVEPAALRNQEEKPQQESIDVAGLVQRHKTLPSPSKRTVKPNVRYHEIREIKRFLEEDNIIGPKDDARTAVLLVMAFKHGQDEEYLSKITGFSQEFVAERVKRWKENGCWENGKFYFEREPGEDPMFSLVEFSIHILVGEGVAVRVKED